MYLFLVLEWVRYLFLFYMKIGWCNILWEAWTSCNSSEPIATWRSQVRRVDRWVNPNINESLLQLPTRQRELSNLLRYSAVESIDESKLTNRIFLMLCVHTCKLGRIWSCFEKNNFSNYNMNLNMRSRLRSNLRLLKKLMFWIFWEEEIGV